VPAQQCTMLTLEVHQQVGAPHHNQPQPPPFNMVAEDDRSAPRSTAELPVGLCVRDLVNCAQASFSETCSAPACVLSWGCALDCRRPSGAGWTCAPQWFMHPGRCSGGLTTHCFVPWLSHEATVGRYRQRHRFTFTSFLPTRQCVSGPSACLWPPEAEPGPRPHVGGCAGLPCVARLHRTSKTSVSSVWSSRGTPLSCGKGGDDTQTALGSRLPSR